MLGGAVTFYDGSVLRNVAEYLGNRIRARGELIPLGYSWTFAVTVDATMALIVVVATLQRPYADLGMCLLAIAIAVLPDLAFFFSGIRFRPSIMSPAQRRWCSSAPPSCTGSTASPSTCRSSEWVGWWAF